MIDLYPRIFHSLHTEAQETKRDLAYLTERHLQILWLEQTLLINLRTNQGEKIEVISPGIWNKEAGPDFLKAHVRIGERYYRGDIEIHLCEEGWYQHGHHCDIRYNQVILHVYYQSSSRLLSISKENGQQPYSCCLKTSIELPIQHLISLIDLDLYAHDIFSNKGHCAEHLFQILPTAKIKQLFQSAAYWRLEKKLNYLQLVHPIRSLQFASGIAMALGYRHNAKAFQELFIYLLKYRDLPYEELLAIALGCCGFLEEGRKESWEHSDYYQLLRSLWWGKKDQITHQCYLKLGRIRPAHHPVRRLAYLVHFLQDHHLEKIWFYALEIWDASMKMIKPSFKKLRDELINIFPTYQNDYWESHYTFSSCMREKRALNLGKEIKLHMLINTILPLMYGVIKDLGDYRKWENFQQFYTLLTIPQTSKSRYLHQRFLGEKTNQDFFEEAQMVQGAYQIHQDFCTHYEASCKGCPFVERYKSYF